MKVVHGTWEAMGMRYKLVPKFYGNFVDVYIVSATGEMRIIARVEFPNDQQTMDNNSCTEEILKALNKRLRRSV